MRSYGKVSTAFWTDDKMLAISDDARLLALFLITGEHSTSLGVFRLGDGAIGDNFPNWDKARIVEALGALQGWFIDRLPNGWTMVRNFLDADHNGPENGNVLASMATMIGRVPEQFKPRLAEKLKPYWNEFGSTPRCVKEQVRQQFMNLFGNHQETVRNGSEPFDTRARTLEPNRTEPEPNQNLTNVTGENPKTEKPRNVSSPDGSAQQYEFESEIIKLTPKDFNRWRTSFPKIDLRAELTSLDAWLASEEATDKQRKGWFHVTAGALKKRNDAAKPPPQQRPRNPKSSDLGRDPYGDQAAFDAALANFGGGA